MPSQDITKCSGIGCAAASICYRHNAPKTWSSSYFAEPPGRDENCDYFWMDELVELWRLSEPPSDPPATRTTT